MFSQVSHPADHIDAYCGMLNLGRQEWFRFRQACKETAEAAKPRGGLRSGGLQARAWDAKHPPTIAAAIIYMLSRLPKVDKVKRIEIKDLKHVSGQAENTIMNVSI